MPIFRVAFDNASAWGCVRVESSLGDTLTLRQTTRRAQHAHPTHMPSSVQMQLKEDGVRWEAKYPKMELSCGCGD